MSRPFPPEIAELRALVAGERPPGGRIVDDLGLDHPIPPAEIGDPPLAGRLHVLGKMLEAMPESLSAISAHAPRIFTLRINPAKIGELIGPGGKMIRSIIEQTGVKIDVEDDGRVNVAATEQEAADKPENVRERIVSGKLDAWLKTVVVLEQEMHNPKFEGKTVQQLRDELTAATGENVVIRRFARFAVGQ